MRDYQNNIEDSPITGFPSACAEYSEKGLSLDEVFDSFNPGLKRFRLSNDFLHLGLQKNDLIDVIVGKVPRANDLIITSKGIFRCRNVKGELDDEFAGVIVAVHRDCIIKD